RVEVLGRSPPDSETSVAAKSESQPLTSAVEPPNHNSLKTPLGATSRVRSELDDAGIEAQRLLEEQQQPTPQLSWRQRAKTFALEYGRVGVCTHIVLSLVSFSTIYVGVSAGLDVSGLLDTVGLSVSASESTTHSAGSFVVAYAIYKLLSPVRWPLTFAVTPVVMRALRRRGFMLPAAAVAAATGRRSPPPPSPPPSSSSSI
ncbi:hypothetical protein PybrP1_007922, partial [[Pythium] brassicae (nom. inval.)]